MDKKNIYIVIVLVLIIAGVIGGILYYDKTPGKYDTFAKCLTEKKAVFYGAFWCPHCLATKALFGKSVKYVDYVECSSADGKEQLQACKDKNIEGYPTWEFSDGTRISGEVSFQQLSDKTSCPLPQ